MATQGLVTIRKAGAVVMKFVAGSDGQHAEKLAQWLNTHGVPATLIEAQELALARNFGSRDTLVVVDTDLVRYQDDEYPDLPEQESLYRKTFEDPAFNPRWSLGIADYTVIIDL